MSESVKGNNIEDEDVFIRKSAVESLCKCASAKCGPHRCWPSKLAWGSVIVLLAWVLVLLSSDAVAIENHRDKQLHEALETLSQQASELLTTQIDSRIAQAMGAPTQALQEALTKMRRDLEYLNTLRWSLETPETLKYAQLKAAIEACELKQQP